MLRRLPFCKLLHHPTKNLLVLAFGNHFQALDTGTGALLATTAPIPEGIRDGSVTLPISLPESERHESQIRTMAFSRDGQLLATSGEDKTIRVWDVVSWKLRSIRTAPKRVVALAFDADGSHIVTADKFGDVYNYLIDLEENEKPTDCLILGHVSMVTDMALSPDNKFIITSDRDEHVRVSHYPKGHIIESYCLGHKQFVSRVTVLPWAQDILLSAGGDDFVALWKYTSGTLLQMLDIKQHIDTPVEASNKTVQQAEKPFLIAVSSIVSNPIAQHVALIIERYPGVMILNWSPVENSIQYKQMLALHADPLDIAFDLKGNLWVSTMSKPDSSEQSDTLLNLFVMTDDQEYVPLNHERMKAINVHGSCMSDTIPDLFPVHLLRKMSCDWQEQSDDDDKERVIGSSEEADPSVATKRGRKDKGPKKKKTKTS